MCQPADQQPRLTLQGLTPLAEFCPKLRSLTVYVDATHFCFNHINSSSSISKSRVKFLEVHRSPIGQSSIPWAAAYLSEVFPRLRKIDWVEDDDEEDEERRAYPKRWLEVMNYLEVCRYIRGHQQDDLFCDMCDSD
ncbi:hypothetical protein BD779DRAFT_530254 [Infundibulicybe gibba]|nr:hypothetical protein BD779DRAFT_530254 [Infundibulicybe gibba]